VSEPLGDDALAGIELAEDVLLHGPIVLGPLPQVRDAPRRQPPDRPFGYTLCRLVETAWCALVAVTTVVALALLADAFH